MKNALCKEIAEARRGEQFQYLQNEVKQTLKENKLQLHFSVYNES